MGDMYNFERGQIVGPLLVGASVAKTVTLVGVSRGTVSQIMFAYKSQRKTISAKRDSGRKSTLTERDCRTLRWTVLKNHVTTAAQVTAELNIHLKDPACIKAV
jgi:transposase